MERLFQDPIAVRCSAMLCASQASTIESYIPPENVYAI